MTIIQTLSPFCSARLCAQHIVHKISLNPPNTLVTSPHFTDKKPVGPEVKPLKLEPQRRP